MKERRQGWNNAVGERRSKGERNNTGEQISQTRLTGARRRVRHTCQGDVKFRDDAPVGETCI